MYAHYAPGGGFDPVIIKSSHQIAAGVAGKPGTAGTGSGMRSPEPVGSLAELVGIDMPQGGRTRSDSCGESDEYSHVKTAWLTGDWMRKGGEMW